LRRCWRGSVRQIKITLLLPQDLSERHDTEILLTTFFESLKSTRRLALLSAFLSQAQTRLAKIHARS